MEEDRYICEGISRLKETDLCSLNVFFSSFGSLNVDELNPDLSSGFSHLSWQNGSRKTKLLHLVFLTNIQIYFLF